MNTINVKCTFPGCSASKPAEHMRVPRWDSMRQANGGKRVGAADLIRFAHCGQHAHRVREDSKGAVQFMLYSVAYESAKKAEAEREVLKVSMAAHLQKFLPKAPEKAKGGTEQVRKPSPRDGRNVGNGLSRAARMDAAKRPSESKPAATDPVPKATQVAAEAEA